MFEFYCLYLRFNLRRLASKSLVIFWLFELGLFLDLFCTYGFFLGCFLILSVNFFLVLYKEGFSKFFIFSL